MKRIVALLVFLVMLCAAGTCTANAELRWSKLGFDAPSKIYVSPGYDGDHSLFALVDKSLYLSVDEGKTWDKTAFARMAGERRTGEHLHLAGDRPGSPGYL